MALFLSGVPTASVFQPAQGWESAFRHLRISTSQGVLVLSVTSAQLLDDEATESLGRELAAAVTRSAARAVVLDLGGVSAVTGALGGILVGLHNLINQRGGRLLLCGLSNHVAEVLRLTGSLGGMDTRAAPLKAAPDVSAAVARLGASRGRRP